MAATNYYVDTDVVGGLGDGSSWANAYASLSLAEAGLEKDLDAANEQMIIHCRGVTNADGTTVLISGWTTAAADYLTIQVDSGDRHDGKWNGSKYRLETDVTISEEYVRFIGLQIGDPGAFTNTLTLTVLEDIRISYCILKNAGWNNFRASFAATGALYIWNTVVYATVSYDAIQFNVPNGSAYIYSCIAASCRYGFNNEGGTVTCKNCYAGNNSTDYNGTIAKTTCASGDTTGTAGLQEIAHSTSAGAYFTNITVDSEDYHIQSSSELKDVGTDTSGDGAPMNFTDDIDGDTRNTWDIGADEYIAVGGISIPIVMQQMDQFNGGFLNG